MTEQLEDIPSDVMAEFSAALDIEAEAFTTAFLDALGFRKSIEKRE